ncbi:Helicase conserved C-terminal domain-containing protein [Trujillonella endophytica]|uniref:Helicase conserved C-terminal domain-containing protein n=2 Tax=Trujillonella endophytica TaxID=673521 RepID=A0A1H8VUJ7_9ACTN|nr:Helicase conserved C-terminal domain-containing protein [Trujillella endophytica]
MLDGEELDFAPRTPAELLSDGTLGDPEAHAIRIQAHYLQHAYRHDPLASLTNARIEPQMHQVFVAHRVTNKLRPRMILADEVGLGKTIEAGLILKELRAREQISRVLIVSPASLTRQWQTELASKFNENFEIMDGAAAKYLGRADANPFLARDNVICSLPFAYGAKRSEQILEAEWDLVIFDEAHRVRRTRQKETNAYKLADELKETTNGLLLLTATPVQLDPFELYSLIQLVEPGMFRNEKAFEQQRSNIPRLNELMKQLEAWDTLSADERRALFSKEGRLLDHVGCADSETLADDHTRAEVVARVVAMHPLADVMVRNRKAELGLAGRRRASTELVELSVEELELYDDVTEYIREGYNRARLDKNTAVGFLMVAYQKMLTSSSHALRTSFRRRIAALQGDRAAVIARARATARSLEGELDDPFELSDPTEEAAAVLLHADYIDVEIRQLSELAARLDLVRDSKMMKAAVVCERILQEPDAKIVIFTQFVETQTFLAKTLRSNGIATALFNGRMDADEKEQAVREFRERASVLVSTEAGGEGRNLQFANHLINFDLPWNPMKVEQRIGRLDRIGQKRPVNIYNLVAQGTLEERVLEVLAVRIRLFEESIGALDPILGSIEKDIERFALSDEINGDASFSLYSEELEKQVLQAQAVEKRLGDFVLDRASFRRDQLNELQQHASMATQDDVAEYCRRILEWKGGFLSDHEDGGDAVHLSLGAMNSLGLQERSFRGVFATSEALRRDDLEFFAFGHALVDKLVAHGAALEGATVGCRYSTDVPPGTWVEVVYETRVRGLTNRGSLVRHLVGENLAVSSQRLTRRPDDAPAEVAPPSWVSDAVVASQRQFDAQFQEQRRTFTLEYEDVRKALLERADRLYAYKKDRLELQVTQAREWLDARSGGDVSARDRKVLPARKGKLAKDLERVAELEELHQLECDDVRRRELEMESTVAWAAVVVGR